jgi:hypothetical protein
MTTGVNLLSFPFTGTGPAQPTVKNCYEMRRAGGWTVSHYHALLQAKMPKEAFWLVVALLY